MGFYFQFHSIYLLTFRLISWATLPNWAKTSHVHMQPCSQGSSYSRGDGRRERTRHFRTRRKVGCNKFLLCFLIGVVVLWQWAMAGILGKNAMTADSSWNFCLNSSPLITCYFITTYFSECLKIAWLADQGLFPPACASAEKSPASEVVLCDQMPWKIRPSSFSAPCVFL